MKTNSKLAIVGVILITLGVTLTVTSYFNVNYWEEQKFYRYEFVIDSSSSLSRHLTPFYSDLTFYRDFPFFSGMPSMQIEVQIEPAYELEDLPNSTTLSTYDLGFGPLNPITVTLGDYYQNISADLQPIFSTEFGTFTIHAVHIFNIPGAVFSGDVTVVNPYNYPVIWIVEVTCYGMVVNNNWLITMLLGITSVTVGAVMARISIRKPAIKQKETATVP